MLTSVPAPILARSARGVYKPERAHGHSIEMNKRAVASLRPTSVEAVPRRRQATVLWLSVALLVLTAAVYAPVRHFAFLNYDDEEYVTDNSHVNPGLTRDGFVWAWTGVHQATWHPLTSLSPHAGLPALRAEPGAASSRQRRPARAQHAVALWPARPHDRASRGAAPGSRRLFALHPLHVESVAWVSERKDVLCTFFWLLTLWAYVAYVRRPGWRAYTLLLVAYIAALLSKPMAVTLPFVLLLLDVWPLTWP